jgi:hypothetical protein
MQPFQKAIDLVNAGARTLKSGCALDAVHLIRQAIVAMKDETQAYHSCTYPSRTTPAVAPMVETICDLADCDGRYFLYERPLEYQGGREIKSREDFESVRHTLSLYAMFNLALACQHFGMVSGTSAPLQRAMELYYTLLSTPYDSFVHNDSTMNYALMQCLALNNLTYIHHERFEYEASQDCVEWMVETFEKTGCLDNCACYLSALEAEEIKVNGMFLRPPSVAQAA